MNNFFSFLTILFTLLINNTNSQKYYDINKIEIIPCGIKTPSEPKDCYKYDTNTNSCCYYMYSSYTGCVTLATRYKGSKIYGELEVSCHSKFLSFSFIISQLVLVIFLILI